jgi:hypothetical protein
MALQTSAATYYVGTCKAGSYSTISAAVNDSAVPPGSTINICPGTYAEQVIVSKALTLQGMTTSSESGAILNIGLIGGRAQFHSPTSEVYGIVLTPAILVQASPVNLNNITIQYASPNTFPDQCSNTKGYIVGVFYSSGSSGNLNHVFAATDTGLGCGVGLWVENGNPSVADSVRVQNSNFLGDYYAAISGAGSLVTGQPAQLTLNLTASQLRGLDGGSGAYLDKIGGTVGGNTISPARGSGSFLNVTANVGIYDNAPSLLLTGNTISDFISSGLVLSAPGTTIKSNRIWNTNAGIDLGCNAGTIAGNTITGASVGLAHVPSAFTGANSFFGVATIASKC